MSKKLIYSLLLTGLLSVTSYRGAISLTGRQPTADRQVSSSPASVDNFDRLEARRLQLMTELEAYWGVEFIDPERWSLQYEQDLSEVFSEMGQLIGGDQYLREILRASAERAGWARFHLEGDGDCGGGASCSDYGLIRLRLDHIFEPDYRTWGPIDSAHNRVPFSGRVIMGHELAHIVLGIATDVDSAYRSTRWIKRIDGWYTDDERQMYANPGEHLVQLIGIRLAGRGWQYLDQQRAAKQIAPSDQAFVDKLHDLVPAELNSLSK